MRALELPLRLEAVEAALSKTPELGGYVGDEQLGNLGRDLGRELVAGGETPLWDALEPELVEEREGDLTEPVDGVIVMRTGEPQMGGSARFLAGLYQGLGSAGVPVVGVEPTRVEQSAIPVFQRYRLSTVDGIDTPVGALALLLVLADPDAAGNYGVRDTRRQDPAADRAAAAPRVAEPLTVLIAARDEAERIGTTIEELRRQFPGAEVIVADDGSRDADGGSGRGGGRARPPAAAPRQGPGADARRAAWRTPATCCSATPTCAATCGRCSEATAT